MATLSWWGGSDKTFTWYDDEVYQSYEMNSESADRARRILAGLGVYEHHGKPVV